MEEKITAKLQYFVIIGKTKLREKFLAMLLENGAHSIDTIYGRGSVGKSILAQAFGLDSEQKKVIISCLLPTENAKKVISILYDEFHFNKANTGVAFGVPIQKLSI